MSTATAEPMPPTQVTFYAHDFGKWTLPAIHVIENGAESLLAGDYATFLMDDAVPSALLDTLKDRTPSEAARFFFMWIMAGFDYEVAAWSATLSLYRTLPSLGVIAEGYEGEDEGEPLPSVDLGVATALYDHAEDVADAIVGSWRLHS